MKKDMKAVIIYRRLKDWPPMMLENIIKGLQNQKIDCEVQSITRTEIKKTDFIIQWYMGEGYLELVEKFKKEGKLLALHIEKGWFKRDEHFLLHNEYGIRYRYKRVVDYTQFFVPIKSKIKKTWYILGQMWNDFNLRNCSKYDIWINTVTKLIKNVSKYDVIFRPHPCSGTDYNVPLEHDLSYAIGVVSWNSSAVLKAMMHDIPVCIYDFPELENDVQKFLTADWIYAVENNTHKRYNKEILHTFAGQQLSIDDFSRWDYRMMYYTNVELNENKV